MCYNNIFKGLQLKSPDIPYPSTGISVSTRSNLQFGGSLGARNKFEMLHLSIGLAGQSNATISNCAFVGMKDILNTPNVIDGLAIKKVNNSSLTVTSDWPTGNNCTFETDDESNTPEAVIWIDNANGPDSG